MEKSYVFSLRTRLTVILPLTRVMISQSSTIILVVKLHQLPER
jgi:hypothetical protein